MEPELVPFSQACENNSRPILEVLLRVFASCDRVLEIGSGTGQHAVFLAKHLPHLHWQPSDLEENHAGIRLWLEEYPSPNVAEPITLDIATDPWPKDLFNGVFSANTAHIMPWNLTQDMITLVGENLPTLGIFALYGPFNYRGEFTSASNEQFDLWLKAHSLERGIRDFEKVDAAARATGMVLVEDNEMPANNRLLVWRKE